MIKKEIIESAKKIARIQGCLAKSPVVVEDEKIMLCAASCIAKAAIEKHGDEKELALFYSDLKNNKAKDLVFLKLEKYGYNRESVSKVMIKNDAKPYNQRLKWFLGFSDYDFVENEMQDDRL